MSQVHNVTHVQVHSLRRFTLKRAARGYASSMRRTVRTPVPAPMKVSGGDSSQIPPRASTRGLSLSLCLGPLAQMPTSRPPGFNIFKACIMCLISSAFAKGSPESTVQFIQYLQEHGIGLEAVVWTRLQEVSVAPAGTFLLPKSPALPACRATRRATVLEKWLSPGTPRAYLQRLLSRQKLLLL
jgi:hypothetical protein